MLNFDLRNARLGGNLGWLFVMYCLHADHHHRCYPSDELLMKETQFNSTATITKYRDQLIEKQAIILVPHDKRMASEAHLHQRKYVYQITGLIIQADCEPVHTLYFPSPEALLSHLTILHDLGFDVTPFQKMVERFDNEDLNLHFLKLLKFKAKVVQLKDIKDNLKDLGLLKAQILDVLKSADSPLSTRAIASALNFDKDVFDVFNGEHFLTLQSLYHDNIVLWQDKETGREYWIKSEYESKVNRLEIDTIESALREHWGIEGIRSKHLAHMFSGSSQHKAYKQYAASFTDDRQITLDEIKRFPAWWAKQCEGTTLPLSPEKLEDYVLRMRKEITKSNDLSHLDSGAI